MDSATQYTIVLDVETTGFPSNRYAKPFYSKCFENARIIEIAYVLMDKSCNIVKEVSYLVKSGVKIENSHIHGITDEMVEADGVDIDVVFQELCTDLQSVNAIMAHNLDFDYKIILSEVYRKYDKNRQLLSQLYAKDLYCTMLMGQRYMGMKKYPKLTELFSFLHDGENWEQSHRALDDVKTCVRCYDKLRQTKPPPEK